MELSDETSRLESSLESSASLGGGGSLGGTAVKAGGFLEETSAVTWGQAGVLRSASLPPGLSLWEALGEGLQGSGVGGGQGGKDPPPREWLSTQDCPACEH